jgi:hypoxanthine-DNA glycosylase
MNSRLITHPWEPVFDANARILILGTIPSPKSRETGFYFGHPQNCFWITLAMVLGDTPPKQDSDAKTRFLLQRRIALWDVLHACQIDGAADASIRDPVPNKFRPLLDRTEIRAIFTTGRKATDLFLNLCADEAGMDPIYLPSTSPANRATQAKPIFLETWRGILPWLEDDPSR